jgi:broad specificity phosphatase PhoE
MSCEYMNDTGSRRTLVLVRHAHTDMAGCFCGTSDPPLSTHGVAQLDGLQRKLEPYRITHIFSSGLQRARQTAESIARRRGLQVQYFEFLHELAFGSWEGLTWDQVMARDPEYAQRWLDQYPSVPAPGGEYFEDFFQRVHHAMTAIAAQVGLGCAAVVTHGGVIRTFLESVARQREVALDVTECDYASCREVWCEDGEWHLPAERAVLTTLEDAKVAQREKRELIL